MSAPTIAPATAADLDDVLPLFAGYQRFYAGAAREDAHNRAFLERFVAPANEAGLLLLARGGDGGDGGTPLGFANLYWTYSSVAAEPHALLNDLFVAEEGRGTGVGRALIDAAGEQARERGHRRMSWQTAVDNRQAQRLYERFDAERTIWFEYELRV